MTFGELVQAAKDARGWSLRQLARQTGVAYSTLRRVLAGHDVMLATALKLAVALGLDAGDLGGKRPARHDAAVPGCGCGMCLRSRLDVLEQLRCYECQRCSRASALVCNNPEGACHPGDCEPETDSWFTG